MKVHSPHTKQHAERHNLCLVQHALMLTLFCFACCRGIPSFRRRDLFLSCRGSFSGHHPGCQPVSTSCGSPCISPPCAASVLQLRAALLAYDALATAAQTVVTAADCGNSTAAQCNSSAIIRSLADADSALAQEIASGQVRCVPQALREKVLWKHVGETPH